MRSQSRCLPPRPPRCVLPSPALAWGKTGHRVVAAIADTQLSAASRARTSSRFSAVPRASTRPPTGPTRCARRPAPFWQKTATPWHYVTLERDHLRSCAARRRRARGARAASRRRSRTRTRALPTSSSRCASSSTSSATSTSRCTSANAATSGGNDVKVTWFGKPTNLHAVWDSALVDDEQLSFTELAAKLERHISNAGRHRLVGHQPARLDQRERAISRARSIRPPGQPRRPSEAEEGRAAAARAVLCLRLQVHAGDGAAAEPGRGSARGLSQRDLRRAAAAPGGAAR